MPHEHHPVVLSWNLNIPGTAGKTLSNLYSLQDVLLKEHLRNLINQLGIHQGMWWNLPKHRTLPFFRLDLNLLSPEMTLVLYPNSWQVPRTLQNHHPHRLEDHTVYPLRKKERHHDLVPNNLEGLDRSVIQSLLPNSQSLQC